MVIRNPDARVHDRVALDEIEMYGNLIIAALESDGPLPQEKIDEILGVAPPAEITSSTYPPLDG